MQTPSLFYLKNRTVGSYPTLESNTSEKFFQLQNVIKSFECTPKASKSNHQKNISIVLSFFKNQKLLNEKTFVYNFSFFPTYINGVSVLPKVILLKKNIIFLDISRKIKQKKVFKLPKERMKQTLTYLIVKKQQLLHYFFEFVQFNFYENSSLQNWELTKFHKNQTISFLQQFYLKKVDMDKKFNHVSQNIQPLQYKQKVNPVKDTFVSLTNDFQETLTFYMFELLKKNFISSFFSKTDFSKFLTSLICSKKGSINVLLKFVNLQVFLKNKQNFLAIFSLSENHETFNKKDQNSTFLRYKTLKYNLYVSKQVFSFISTYFCDKLFLNYFEFLSLTNLSYKFGLGRWANPSVFSDFSLLLNRYPTKLKNFNLNEVFQLTENDLSKPIKAKKFVAFFPTLFFEENTHLNKILFHTAKTHTVVYFLKNNMLNLELFSFFSLLKTWNFPLNFYLKVQIKKTLLMLKSDVTSRNSNKLQFFDFLNSFTNWSIVSKINYLNNNKNCFNKKLIFNQPSKNILFESKQTILNFKEIQFPNKNKLKFVVLSSLKTKNYLQMLETLSNNSVFQKNLLVYLKNLKQILKMNSSQNQLLLIKKLTPKLLSYCYFYRFFLFQKSVKYLDQQFFMKIWRWSCRRHNNKSKKWIQQKYFFNLNKEKWVFGSYFLTTYRASNFTKKSLKLQYLPSHFQLFKILKQGETIEYFSKIKNNRKFK